MTGRRKRHLGPMSPKMRAALVFMLQNDGACFIGKDRQRLTMRGLVLRGFAGQTAENALAYRLTAQGREAALKIRAQEGRR